MGYNTTVVVLNDALGEIATDKEFGRKLVDAICGLSLGINMATNKPFKNRDVSAGMYMNAATVIEQHHSSGNAIVAVGGNCGTVIGHTGSPHHLPEHQEEVLRMLANQLGFKLVRIKKAK